MSLATEVLKYNQNIEESMFRKMPNVVNKPLSKEQLKQFEGFSALGTIKEVNLLNELQLGQLLKENNIILPVGMRPSSAEAMVFIQQKLAELSQGRDKTLTLFDLINIQQQSKEKVEAKLGVMGERLKTMNDLLFQEQRELSEAREGAGAEEEKTGPITPITDFDVMRRNLTTIKKIEEYSKTRGFGNIPSQINNNKLDKQGKLLWVWSKEIGRPFLDVYREEISGAIPAAPTGTPNITPIKLSKITREQR